MTRIQISVDKELILESRNLGIDYRSHAERGIKEANEAIKRGLNQTPTPVVHKTIPAITEDIPAPLPMPQE